MPIQGSQSGPASRLPVQSVQDRLAWQQAELAILQQVRIALTESANIQQIIARTVDALADLLGYSHVCAYLIMEGDLHLVHQFGFAYPMPRLRLTTGVCGQVAMSGKPAHIANVMDEPAYLAVNDGIESEICVPFGALGETRGVLNIESGSRSPLSDRDFKLIQEVGNLLSLAIERAELANATVSVGQRLESALDAAAMGAWTWAIPTDAWEWTFAERTGGSVRELDGCLTTAQLRKLIHAGDVAHVDSALRTMILTGDLDLDFRLSIDTGAPIWLNLRGHAIDWMAPNQPARIAGVVTDVSGRKRLEEERIRLTFLETERINAELTQRTMETTIERLTDGFISTNPALEITLINEPAAILLDSPRDELPGVNLLDAVAGFADQLGWKRMVDAAMAPLPSSVDIYDARSARFIDAHIYPGTGGVTIYLRDVTRLREAEFERQMSEARFRSLVQQASDMTVVLDRAGDVTYCSPAIERILGYEPSDLIDRFPPDLVHPADRKRLRRAFLQLLHHHGTGLPIELRMYHRDGTVRWIEATPTNLLTDVSVRGIVVNCRDVTDRHAAERNLWLSAEVASVIGASLDAETMIDGLIRLLTTYLVDCAAVAIEDHDGVLQLFRLGWKRTEQHEPLDESIIGPGLVTLVRTNRLQGISAAERSVIDIERMLATADPGSVAPLLEHLRAGDIRTICVPGIAIMGEWRGALLIGSSLEQPPGLAEIALAHDAARRLSLSLTNAELYDRAQQAIATRDRFLSVAAHELRTPITSVAGYADMLGKEVHGRNDPARIDRYVGRLQDAGTRLKSLAEDLLDVSRLHTSELTLRRGEIDLAVELVRIIAGFRDRGEAPNGRVYLAASGTPRPIEGDAERMEQVCSNLLSNALKYSPPESTVQMHLVYEPEQMSLIVTDQGIGIDSGALQTIFDPFGRAANALGSDVPGLGLGLYIARSIVSSHGGTITAASDGPGTGTTMTVTLPYAQ